MTVSVLTQHIESLRDGASMHSMQTPSPTCRAKHGTNERAGYVIRRTYFDGRDGIDVATFSRPDVYAKAIQVAHSVRSSVTDGYAVIDGTYKCGCRVAG